MEMSLDGAKQADNTDVSETNNHTEIDHNKSVVDLNLIKYEVFVTYLKFYVDVNILTTSRLYYQLNYIDD